MGCPMDNATTLSAVAVGATKESSSSLSALSNSIGSLSFKVKNLIHDFQTLPIKHAITSRMVWERNNNMDGNNTSKSKRLERSSQHFRLSGQFAPRREIRKEEGDGLELKSPLEEEEGGETDTQDEEMSPSNNLSFNRTKTHVSSGLERVLNGPLAQNNPDLLYRPGRLRVLNETAASKIRHHDSSDGDNKENEISESFTSSRSKTMPTLCRPKVSQPKLSLAAEGERLRNAKEIVEKAIKYKKVFTIQGGYATIRHSLRRRGWVEKFYKIPGPDKKTPRSKKRKSSDDDDGDADGDDDDDDDDDDDTDDDNDQPKVPPWEEDDGVYGIMSRMVRNVNPTFIWVLKGDSIDYRYLSRDQMVNHYCKAGSFTTKVGLCVNMRNVSWYDNSDQDTFFPRCYRLSHDEDKSVFIDDYRLTACVGTVKMAVEQSSEGGCDGDSGAPPGDNVEAGAEEPDTQACTNPECTRSRPGSTAANKCVCKTPADAATKEQTPQKKEAEGSKDGVDENNSAKDKNAKKKKKRIVVPIRVLETAMYQCERFLASREHDDIDIPDEVGQLTDNQWDDFIQWYYQLAHEDGAFSKIPSNLLGQSENLLQRMSHHCPQIDLDGTRNVWIVKPGAKSRGRGITCYDKLEDMLKLVNSSVVKKDGKYVVQKYMERPLLIYNTKFDIRQWFLVTDWNPLTVWFYQDSYLRFCSQQYSLEDFDQGIHLSNFSIQKYYKNGPRSSRLPADNMWSHEQFKDYLAEKKKGNIWDDFIYPRMKRAVICSLLVTQDIVEYRKASFELYGADFMLTEDYSPWLIEINSGPSMEASTAITAKLCKAVLDDTVKVVVDRKFDRNCDTGAFELAYKQPVVSVPPYIGINLCVEGQTVRKPNSLVRHYRPPDHAPDSLFVPRNPVMKQTIVDRNMEIKKSSNQGSSSAGAAFGGGSHHPHRKDNSKTPDGTTSRNTTVGVTGRGMKEVPSKVGTFRTSGDVAVKEKPKLKLTNGNHHNNTDVSNSDGDLTDGGGGVNHPSHNKRTRTTESKKSDGVSTIVQSDSNSTMAVPRVGDSLDLKVENGIPPSQPQRVLPNTPYLAGLNQRRFVSKTSVSANYTIPAPPGGGDKGLASGTAAILNSSSVWNNNCQWCGRGGNLFLDQADPNCRCQQDSVLVTNTCIPQIPLQPKQQDVLLFNHRKSSKLLNAARGHLQGRKSPRFVSSSVNHHHQQQHRPHHLPRNAISVTPTHVKNSEIVNDSPGYFQVGENVTPERPLSSCSNDLKIHTGRLHEDRAEQVYFTGRSKVRQSQKHHHQQQQQQQQQQHAVGYNPDNWQILISNQHIHHSEFPRPHNNKYNNSNNTGHNHNSDSDDLRSPGFPGSTYYTRRVKSLIARKSAPSALTAMWQNFTPIQADGLGNPLSVVARRRSRALGKRKY